MKQCLAARLVPPTEFIPLFFLLLLGGGSLHAQFSIDREPPGPSSRTTGLVITEIMYNPRPVTGLSTNLTHEFVEVFNSKPWDENLGGFAIDGTVRYVFPSNTILRAGAYLVVARVPDMIRTNYGVTNVFGPWDGATTNRLSTEQGTVQLRNRQGAVLLTVNYSDSPPWPEAADGAGHSLSLARPSYGENDFRAWSESDRVGGSPGGPDPLTLDPLSTVFINEWQNHSDPVDWIELYNHGNDPVDVSGAYLSDDPTTNRFRIPNGTVIPGRGFISYDQTQLGFELFAGGETIFLWNSNQTRVVDVIDFRGQSNNISSGRFPDGGPIAYGMATRTRGAPNSRPMRYPVVITEIMFSPISGNADEEYIEIHNRNSTPVNISGWEFVTGIGYTFTTNPITVSMPGGAYWVIARNPTNLFAIYSNLNTNNTFGPYSGTLANGGERVTFTAADYDNVQNPGGGSTVEKLPVPISDLIYGDGGKWGNWSDGGGSSLEILDVEADGHHPSNWADSNDTGESQWTAIEYNGPLGEMLGSPVNDSVMVMSQGVGEYLVDEIEVRVDGGPNLVANGGFESGLSSWTLQGSHDFSTVENEGFNGGRSLHLRAGSRGDNQSNRILSSPFANPIPPGAGTVSIRAKVRWLRGHPEILLRLRGSATEAYGRLSLPRRLGTPGAPNSRGNANLGPAVYDVKHSPVLPAVNAAVVVTARATDFQTVAAMKLRYRVDPAPTYTDLAMLDDGTGGDTIMDDGIYSATIPGQPAGSVVAFYVEGRDNQNAIGTFPGEVFPQPGFDRCWPTDAVARECVVRWGEVQMPGDFATYHLWVTAVNSNRWHTRSPMNNTEMDGTFVYNNSRVIYNALPLFSGSPWHRTNSTTGPAGPNRVDFEMNFPEDEPLLGTTDFVLNNPGNPDILTISDLSAVAEQTVYKIFESLDLTHNHRRNIHFFVNGNQRSTAHERPGNFIFEDSQQPNGDMIAQWFPNNAGGNLYKVEDWFEFNPNGFDPTANNDADMTRRTVMLDGQPAFVPATYRYMFRKRSVNVGNSANDFSEIYQLIDAASPEDNPDNPVVDPDLFATVADWEQWMRHFAVHRAVGNWDSFGWERGKNDYLYSGGQGGFQHMPWDIDYSLGLGRGPTEPLFASNDPRIVAMFNTPGIVRAYWRAFAELVAGPFSNANLDPFIDTRVGVLLANNINIDLNAVAAIKTYIGARRTFLQSQLATVDAAFTVGGSLSYSTTNNLVFINGTAPVNVKQITLNGLVYPITWTTVSNFTLRVVLGPGLNEITLAGIDRFSNVVSGASQALSLTYTGPVVDPNGALILSEVMSTPSANGGQFVEIVNRSQANFDLSGWRLDGANMTFPVGSIVTNGQTLVLAQNRTAFRTLYGDFPVFATFGGLTTSQPILLVRPGVMDDEIIDGVRFETTAPWPRTVAGESRQLIDAAQDNSRPSNWAVNSALRATPGAPNSVAAALPAYESLWLNELQIESLVGPMDNAGESEPWLEIHNSGLTPVSLDGYYLATSYTNNLTEWPFPAGITLAPGEHKLIWADGEPGEANAANPHTAFRLGSNGRLALVRLVNSQPQVTDYLTWPTLGANVSYGAFPDGQLLRRFVIHTPTPGGTNSEPPLRLFINEWLAINTTGLRDPADNALDDWFELHNAEARPVDLSGYYLTDDLGNPTKYRIPTNSQYVIPAGGFLLVWADDQTAQNNPARGDLHANFRLGTSGAIGFFAPDGVTPVDTITYGLQSSDISEGRYADGAGQRYSMLRTTPRLINSIVPIYNTPPVFPNFPTQFVAPGGTNNLTIRAVDPDGNGLTHSLVDAPAGVQLNASGLYRWIVPTNQPPGEYFVTVRVADSGSPSRSSTTTVTVVVASGLSIIGTPAPVIRSVASPDGQATFSFVTIPGRRYRVVYKEDLANPTWVQLDVDFVATVETTSVTDHLSRPHRFYQVWQMD